MHGPGTEDHPRSSSYWRYVRHSSSFYSSVLEGINCLVEPSGGNINTIDFLTWSVLLYQFNLIQLPQVRAKAVGLAAMVFNMY
jgi:hypothetical protein